MLQCQQCPGTEVSFALFPEGGDVGAWMGFVAFKKDSPSLLLSSLLSEDGSRLC